MPEHHFSTPGFSLDRGEHLVLLDSTIYPALAEHQDLVDFVLALSQAETVPEKRELLSSDPVIGELLDEAVADFAAALQRDG